MAVIEWPNGPCGSPAGVFPKERCLFGGWGAHWAGLFCLAEGAFEAVAGDEEDEEGNGGDDNRDVAGLAKDRDAAGDEVEWGDQVGDEGDQEEPGCAADGPVAEEGARAAAGAGQLLLRSVDYSGDPAVEQPDRTRPRPHQGGRHRNVECDRR